MGLADKAKQLIESSKEGVQDFFMENILESLAPKLKKLLPKFEAKLKPFFQENDCYVLVRQEKNGDIVGIVFDKKKIKITFPDGDYNDAIKLDKNGEKMLYSFDGVVDMLIGGGVGMLKEEHSKKENKDAK